MKKIAVFLMTFLIAFGICGCSAISSPVIGDWFSVQLTDGEIVMPYKGQNALSIKNDGTLSLLDGEGNLESLVGTWEENNLTSSSDESISYIVTFQDTESDARFTAVMMYQTINGTPTVCLLMDDYMISFEKRP